MASKDMIAKIILKGQADPSLQKAFATASKYSDTYIDKLNKVGDVAKKAFTIVATAAAAGGAAAVKAAIDYESAFAGVKKTVEETSTTSYAELSDGVRELAKVTPAAATEIAAVAAAAGQLGIKADDILPFSKTMIDLGESTNLTAEEAATAFAKMFNITGTSMDMIDRAGSTLVALGNNAATTEKDILEMASRIASSATQIGMSETELLALATSLSSVGLEAQGGGTAIATVMTEIDKAVALNTDSLAIWASTAGMGVAEFAALWETDAYGAMQRVVAGMGETNAAGGNLNVLLDDLGITGIRTSDTMKRLSNASGLMADMTDLANKAWTENTALSNEANTRYATTASRLQILKNNLIDAAITIGNKLLPYINMFIDKIQSIDFEAVASKICGAIDWIVEHADTLVTIASVIAGAFIGIKIAGFIQAIISAVQVISGLVKTFGLLKVVMASLGGPVTIIITVVSALVAGFIALWNTSEGFRNFWINLWNNIKSIASTVGNWLANFFTVTIPNAFNAVVTFFQQLPSNILSWLISAGQSIAAWGANLWAKAKEIGANFVNGVVSFFQQLPYRIGYAIGVAIGKVIQFGQKLWTFVTTTIPQAISSMINWFAQLPGRIWTWLVNTATRIVQWGIDIKAKATAAVTQLINAVVQFFAQLPGRIWTWLVNAATQVVAWGADLVAKGRQAVSDLVNTIISTIQGLPGQLLSIGKNIVEGLWNGISGAAGWLMDKIKSFASGIIDGIASVLGIHSPSVVMMKLAKFVPKGFGIGIEKNTKYAIDAVENMGGEITATASKINPTISTSSRLPKFGTGGTVTSPQTAIVGDKPETIVPHGNTKRNRSLLAEAARGVGVSGGSGSVFNFTFAPVINGGNVDENRAMLQDEEEKFEQQMTAWMAKNRRLAF